MYGGSRERERSRILVVMKSGRFGLVWSGLLREIDLRVVVEDLGGG